MSGVQIEGSEVTRGGENSGRSGMPAVFLDRDGVLVRTFVVDGKPVAGRRLEDFEILPGVPAGLDALKRAGFVLVVVTNQPDVGNGLIDAKVVEAMHDRLRAALPLDSVKVCYHVQGEGCACRKPMPGMLLDAAAELDLDLAASFLIGDRWSDIVAGASAGCYTIFIDRQYSENDRCASPDARVASFEDAYARVLTQERLRETGRSP